MPLRVLRSSALGRPVRALGGQEELDELPLLVAQLPELHAPSPLFQRESLPPTEFRDQFRHWEWHCASTY